MEKLLFRLLLVPLTTFFLLHALTYVNSGLYAIFYSYFDGFEIPLHALNIVGNLLLLLMVVWTLAHTSFEIVNYLRPNETFSYWLKILRYTPIAGVLLAIPITIAFDLGMVQYSKWKIRSYVYSNDRAVTPPDLDLHNTDRGWCGNGAVATLNYLYFETASEGMNNADPYVRSRSLLAAAEVRNWVNGGDPRFDQQLNAACLDEHMNVYQTAEHYLRERNSSCALKLAPNKK